MKPKDQINVPNMLSLYRIIIFPVILCFILLNRETWFFVLLMINLITDILDGMIARKYHLNTDWGARLDSMGDNLTYTLAFTGILVFKLEAIRPYLFSFFTFMGLAVALIVLSLIKFGRFPSFHLYSFKLGGYIQGIFFFMLFTCGFVKSFYYFMIVWAILACIEHIIIQLIIPEMRSNVKSLYRILKERKTQTRQSAGNAS